VCSFREWAVTELSRRGREGITSFRFHGTEERPEMKALVYHGPGKRSWEEKPKPVIQDSSDAIVRILRTTICGSDLHILKGHVPSATDGRILGHEGPRNRRGGRPFGVQRELGSRWPAHRVRALGATRDYGADSAKQLQTVRLGVCEDGFGRCVLPLDRELGVGIGF
jgi:hypothetical protein